MKKDIIMSIDLEWFFHDDVELFNNMNLYQRKTYNGDYICKAVNMILDICSKNDTKLTFFVLGEIYDAYPDLIHVIKERGHEIAYHTHMHTIIHSKEDLEKEIKMSKSFINEFSPKGFRAPNIYMNGECLKVLEDHGFEYDSSTYGTIKFRRGNITILPISVYPYFKKIYTDYPNPLTLGLMLRSIPFGSGLFLGMMKNNITYFINRYSNDYKEPPIIFVHSWQIMQKRVPTKFKLRKPFMIPYSTSLINTFDYITSQLNILKMGDYI